MKAIIFGATGMVGREVLQYCLNNGAIERVISISRQSTGITHSKLQEVKHNDYLNFSKLEQMLKGVDVCYYCLGVYQGKVDKQAFWEVTVDYVSALIDTLGRVNPTIRFCLFSAQGADQTEKTPFLFGKVKGRAEKYLVDSTLKDYYIFRPGFINPTRKSSSFMWSSMIFKPIYKIFPIIGIGADDLGAVIVDTGINGSDVSVLENAIMRSMSKRSGDAIV